MLSPINYAEPTTEGVKILIADDFEYLIDFIEAHLSRMLPEASFIRARNGYEVCTMAIRHAPDLILLDWEMPDFSGIGALQTLQGNPSTKEIPVIMVSGFSTPSHVNEALSAGAVDYLKKPIEPTELIARVRTALKLCEKIKQLQKQKEQIELVKLKRENLLKGLLPPEVLLSYEETGEIMPRRFRNVSVVMADLVDFTVKSQKMSPRRLLDELQTIFTAFDEITEKYKCTRIKTIGDAYMAVSGMWNQTENHALNAAKLADRMRQYIIEHNHKNKIDWKIRIGINSEDIIAGIPSRANLTYDIFGDTVNTAARMQTYSDPMQINISESTYQLLKDYYIIIKRISRKVKGKGALNMYYLHRPHLSRIPRSNEIPV